MAAFNVHSGFAIASITASGLAIGRYGGSRVYYGRRPSLPYLQGHQRDGFIKVAPMAEEKAPEKNPITLRLCRGQVSNQHNLETRYSQNELPYEHSLLQAYHNGTLQRLVILTLNPDELASYATEIIGLWEQLVTDAHLNTETTQEYIKTHLPLFAPASNGIVADGFRQELSSQINKSTILNRFLTSRGSEGPMIKATLLETILRVLPLQAANRPLVEGSTIYQPAGIGSVEIAGGTEPMRDEVAPLLISGHNAYRTWLGLADEHNYVSGKLKDPRAADFMKAMFTININALAIVLSLQDDKFQPVTMGQMAVDYTTQVKTYAQALYNIAAMAKYTTADNLEFQPVFDKMIGILKFNAEHTTSSVRRVLGQIEAGKVETKLGPNEVWLFEPAIALADRLGLYDEVNVLSGLRLNVLGALEQLSQG